LALGAEALDLGVCAHVTWDEFSALDRTCDMCVTAGFKSIRCDFEWSVVQGQRGAPFVFSRFDTVVEAAQRRGMTILPILAGPPKWAKPITEHLDEWREFVRAVVSHFGSCLPAVEIWNEENLETFWPNVNAADYVRVLAAAAAVVRETNPKVKVVLGGLSNVPLDYLRELYAAGGKTHFDVMNVHPYCWPYPPEGDKTGSAGLKEDIRNLRRFMASQGDADKPIWITEHGWPTHRAKLPEALSLLAGLKLANPGREAWHVAYACLGEPSESERQLAVEIKLALPKGSSVEACSPCRINEKLSGGLIDAVIYPFSEAFPIETADAVVDFVSRGGTLVDFGGFPMFYPYRDGEFAGLTKGWSDDADKVRQRLRIGLSAHWMDAALPDSLMAQPTDDARGAGLVGDPRGFYVYRFFTAERLKEGDRMIPMLVGRDKAGRSAVGACVYKFGSDMKGAVVVSCRGNLVREVSETEQAEYLKRSIDISADCGVEKYFIYEFRAPELNPHYSEYHFGIVHADFAPKPAYRLLVDLDKNRERKER